MQLIEHRRGDTFTLKGAVTDSAGLPINIEHYTISSHIKPLAVAGGHQIVHLVVEVTDAIAGRYTLRAPGNGTSAGWPVGIAHMDITYGMPSLDPNNREVYSTQVISVDVKAGVTKV